MPRPCPFCHPCFPVVARVASGILLAAFLTACQLPDDPLQAFEQGDYVLSYRLWLPRAEAGDAEAQNYVGIQHYLGLGCSRDLQLAFSWFVRAARQGHPPAQVNLGSMYQAGRGVEQNLQTAFVWFFAAARQGSERARRQAGYLGNRLSRREAMYAMLEANEFIPDPALRFVSRDYYIDQNRQLHSRRLRSRELRSQGISGMRLRDELSR